MFTRCGSSNVEVSRESGQRSHLAALKANLTKSRRSAQSLALAMIIEGEGNFTRTGSSNIKVIGDSGQRSHLATLEPNLIIRQWSAQSVRSHRGRRG